MNFDQNVPQQAPSHGGRPEAKDWAGPRWVKNVRPGIRFYFAGQAWQVQKVEDRGRVIHWLGDDGRVARCQCTAGHPDCPPDPTDAQLRQESLDRLHARPTRYTY